MKLKLIFFLSLNIISVVDACRIIKLCNAKVLNKRIETYGLGFFNRKTNIVKMLANKALTPEAIVKSIDSALFKYEDIVKNRSLSAVNKAASIEYMQERKDVLIEIILNDQPSVLKELNKLGIYKPLK